MRRAPTRLTATSSSIAGPAASSSRVPDSSTPAELTRRSSPPRRSTTPAKAARDACSDVTSSGAVWRPATPAAARSSLAGSRLATTTRLSSTSRRASARPMPDAPPVMRIRRSRRSIVSSSPGSGRDGLDLSRLGRAGERQGRGGDGADAEGYAYGPRQGEPCGGDGGGHVHRAVHAGSLLSPRYHTGSVAWYPRDMQEEHRYGHFCPLARALELVGERW